MLPWLAVKTNRGVPFVEFFGSDIPVFEYFLARLSVAVVVPLDAILSCVWVKSKIRSTTSGLVDECHNRNQQRYFHDRNWCRLSH